jgi:preprotein translocase subunit SecE
VARNRKRAKERRASRRPAGNGGRPAGDLNPDDLNPDALPGPLEHAAPDVELAEEQLAVGRPDLQAGEDLSTEAEAEEREEELEDAGAGYNGDPPVRIGGGLGGRGGGGGGGGGGAAAGAVPLAEPRPAGLLSRLIGFLQGSWRELQRVQWPDRRQVAQATGVVLGFVIVAGVFLGLCDLAFSHLMNYILK